MINDSINRFLGILCYPFTSMDAFGRDSFQEYIVAINEKKKDKKKVREIRERLKGELIGYIRQNYNIYSYDEIYLYLEKCYLYDAEKYDSALQLYQHILRRIATTLISHRDGKVVFKYWKNKDDEEVFGGFAGSNKIILFHSLNCHIPMDVISITYMIISQTRSDIHCLDYFYGNIEVADQQLSRIFEKGVSENHLHKGVSRTFPSIWDSLMKPLTVNNRKNFYDKKLLSDTEEKNKWMLFHILGCGIVRIWLVLKISKFSVHESEIKESYSQIEKLVSLFSEGEPFENYYKELFQDKEAEEITSHFMNMWEILESFIPEGSFQDKICTRILQEDLTLHTFDENIFLYYALKELLDERDILGINQCIMQYLRIRNNIFHTSVQQKTIKGLDYFQQEHYMLNSALNHINIKDFWENAIREQLQNQDLHKIEFRSSIPKTYGGLKKEILSFLKAYKKVLEEDYCFWDGKRYMPVRRIPQVGLVLHFLKRPDETIPEKCFQNGKKDCSYFQFGELQKSYKKQIDSFIQLRSEFNELTRYLVGIDAASLENSTPIWAFVPIYEAARDSRVEGIGRNYKDGGYTQSLGFTFHAGEDFRHILSGLRRIDEAVEYLKFHAGDRIGHGIALGMPARIWQSQNPVIVIPQIEALENYLWAFDTLSKNYYDFQATILAYMEKRIFEFSSKIYGCTEGLTVETLISGYQNVFMADFNVVTNMEVAKMSEELLCKKLWSREPILWNSNLLAAARHCKRFVKEMDRPIHYEITEQDLLVIEALQKILIKKLGRKGIVVEINPSSNTAIADLDVFGNSQLYHMNNIYDEENVIVCINSDDPAVFNTNVSNELAYIYYGMLERGIGREAALRWLDQIRENGVNSSFIHHQEPDDVLMDKLNRLIESM